MPEVLTDFRSDIFKTILEKLIKNVSLVFQALIQ